MQEAEHKFGLSNTNSNLSKKKLVGGLVHNSSLERLNEFHYKKSDLTGKTPNQQTTNESPFKNTSEFGISNNDNQEKIKRNSEVIALMRKVLETKDLIKMTKILQEIKGVKTLDPQLHSIKVLFFGGAKDVRIDKQFNEKKSCLECLCKTLPPLKQQIFSDYFN